VAFREPIVCFSTVAMVMVSYRQAKPKPIACITYQSAAVGCMGSCDVGSGWYISLGRDYGSYMYHTEHYSSEQPLEASQTYSCSFEEIQPAFLAFEGGVTDMNLGRGPSGRGRKGHVSFGLGSRFPFHVH
jgi:hypothetical protein